MGADRALEAGRGGEVRWRDGPRGIRFGVFVEQTNEGRGKMGGGGPSMCVGRGQWGIRGGWRECAGQFWASGDASSLVILSLPFPDDGDDCCYYYYYY